MKLKLKEKLELVVFPALALGVLIGFCSMMIMGEKYPDISDLYYRGVCIGLIVFVVFSTLFFLYWRKKTPEEKEPYPLM